MAKLKIQKVCENCSKVFDAQRTTTRYCSHKCNSVHYKLKARDSKINKANADTIKVVNKPIEDIKTKEFLSVSQTAKLIGCSRQAIYKMINSGRLKASIIMVKKTIIKRSDIELMLEQAITEKQPRMYL